MFFGFANFNTDEIKRLLPGKAEQFVKGLLDKSGFVRFLKTGHVSMPDVGFLYGKCNLTPLRRTIT